MKKQFELGFTTVAVQLNSFHSAILEFNQKKERGFLNSNDKGEALIKSLKKQFLPIRQVG
ncbi:MAG TPA: hypothetical protein PLQ93_00470 [Bacteroidia bacterium]|nr:hypothetical protein [Bacteroidia bacterium]